MARKLVLQLASLVAYLSSALANSAVNDWSKPCFGGECNYDLPADNAWRGYFKLLATPEVLTDITPAAGWVILDCDPNTLDQDIRLVCESDDEASGCHNVFDHAGPVNKIVRLPESCGHGPFARIADMRTADDQTLPSHTQSKIQRRDGSSPLVHKMTIDGNFDRMDRPESINYAFIGLLGEANFDVTAIIGDVYGFLKKYNPVVMLASHVVPLDDWVDHVVKVTAKAIHNAGKWVGDTLENISATLQQATQVTVKPALQETKLNLTGPSAKFSKSPDWPTKCSTSQALDFNVTATSGGEVTMHAGIVLVGSLMGVDHMSAFGGMSGEVWANLNVAVKLSGGFHPPELSLVTELGLPGFSIPKIFSIGPYFSLKGKAEGHLEVNIDTNIKLSYTFEGLHLWYSSDGQQMPKGKDLHFGTKESEFGISASAEVKAQGFLKASLIPAVNFGVSAGGSVAELNIHLAAELWARALVEATVTASASHKARKVKRTPDFDLIRRVDTSFQGCFWVDSGLRIYASAVGKLYKWTIPAGELDIYTSKEFDLFHKCWGGQSNEKKPTFNVAEVKKPAKCVASVTLPKKVTDKLKAIKST
ncbi:hypothetical protein ONZ45_g9934 [Pleurotus djamor]|nr:hypothetical protein ONZ45_g9934 [Pleurotus djamor]